DEHAQESEPGRRVVGVGDGLVQRGAVDGVDVAVGEEPAVGQHGRQGAHQGVDAGVAAAVGVDLVQQRGGGYHVGRTVEQAADVGGVAAQQRARADVGELLHCSGQ